METQSGTQLGFQSGTQLGIQLGGRVIKAPKFRGEGYGKAAGDDVDDSDDPTRRLVGYYERTPVANNWHKVNITLENSQLRWKNAAGVSLRSTQVSRIYNRCYLHYATKIQT